MVPQDSLIRSHGALLIGFSILSSWLHAKQKSQLSFEQQCMWQIHSTGTPNTALNVGKRDKICSTHCSFLYVNLAVRKRYICQQNIICINMVLLYFKPLEFAYSNLSGRDKKTSTLYGHVTAMWKKLRDVDKKDDYSQHTVHLYWYILGKKSVKKF